ncbi:uncharacterized protein LOC141857461 [Brevipalpus obovatus]|uniref:uncharacterized protein LOC141857461 n=1 Tax=Brevipalpus obovatus TaxID=246614 RepID=UPI003D9E395D
MWRFVVVLDFIDWKERIENEEKVFYIMKVRKNNERTYYECSRSGNYKPEGKNLKSLKIKGSRKIGARCPSGIRLHMYMGIYKITYFKTHAGHKNELKHLDIPQKDRQLIASQISLGMTRQIILQNIRATWTKENDKRIHRLRYQDLRNISRDFKLRSNVVRNQNDLVSVESHIEQMRTQTVDPIIIYQEQDSEHNLPLILGICNEGQRFMLDKYGGDIIAIDSTHGTNDYNFQLTTIMVVDENRTGFPVAFFYSSDLLQDTCKSIFQALKKVTTISSVNVFMSDDYPAYYNAWIEVFHKPSNRLLCTWHVLRNWTKKSPSKVSNKEERQVIMNDLFSVQQNLDEKEFEIQAKYFMNKYEKQASTLAFIEYFRTYYWSRKEQWALCYRKNLGINTNMFLESLHKNLKYIFMAGKKVRRLDESINCLSKMLNNYQYERIIRLEQGFIPKKLAVLRQRHKRSLGCKFLINQSSNDQNEWLVISNDSGEPKTYTVCFLDGFESCTCLVKCFECQICIKSVRCECFDYCVRRNFCKHIHYVAMKRGEDKNIPERQSDDNEKSDELHIELNQVEDNQVDEMEILLPSNSFSQAENVEEKRKSLMQKFVAALDECSSVQELEAVENFVMPMLPTVNAIKLKSSKQISNLIGSHGSSRNIEGQRRFKKVPKKRKSISRKQRSYLAEELFCSQQTVQFDHDY